MSQYGVEEPPPIGSSVPFFEEQGIEKAVIGVAFLDNLALDEMIEFGVRPWWFRSNSNRLVWEGILKVRDSGETADIVSTAIAMEQEGTLAKLPTGAALLAECASEVATSKQALWYCKTFRKYVKLRMLFDFSVRLPQKMRGAGLEPEEIIADIKNEIQKVEELVEEPTETMGGLYDDVFYEVTRFDRKPPISTGFPKLDDVLGGLYESEMTIVAGQSGLGKTAFLTTLLRNINRQKIPVAMFSLEMNSTILAMRVLSSQSRIDLRDIRDGKVDMERLGKAIERYGTHDFYVKSDCWAIEEIEAAARLMVKTKGVKVIGVDYIQLVDGSTGANRTREQEMSAVGRSLKKIAKDLNVHVVALAQLDDAWDNKPTGRNIRESKALKHHTDNVILLYHSTPNNPDGRVNLKIDKARNSRIGEFQVGLIGRFTEFVDDPDTIEMYRESYR